MLSLDDAWERESLQLVINKGRSKIDNDKHFLEVAT